jgi:hypothetical protein
MVGVHFFGEKIEQKTFFPLKTGPLGGNEVTVCDYRTPYVKDSGVSNHVIVWGVRRQYNLSLCVRSWLSGS